MASPFSEEHGLIGMLRDTDNLEDSLDDGEEIDILDESSSSSVKGAEFIWSLTYGKFLFNEHL